MRPRGCRGDTARWGRQPRGAPGLRSRWLLPARAGGAGACSEPGDKNPKTDRGDGRSPVGALAAGPRAARLKGVVQCVSRIPQTSGQGGLHRRGEAETRQRGTYTNFDPSSSRVSGPGSKEAVCSPLRFRLHAAHAWRRLGCAPTAGGSEADPGPDARPRDLTGGSRAPGLSFRVTLPGPGFGSAVRHRCVSHFAVFTVSRCYKRRRRLN